MHTAEEVGDRKVICFSFTWRIENFSVCLLSEKQTIESPEFQVNQFLNSKWKLQLYIPGKDEENVTINLYRCEAFQGDRSRVEIDGKLFVAKNDGSFLLLEKFGVLFLPTFSYIAPLTISRKAILENSNTYLLKDTLTVGFHFFVSSSKLKEIPVKCYARSKMVWEKYSFLLPLQVTANYIYPSILPIASSSEKPEIQVELCCLDSNKHDFPFDITIQVKESNYKGVLQCKVVFLNEEVVKFKTENTYTFEPKSDVDSWSFNIPKATFDKYSISGTDCLKCELVVSTGKLVSFLENTVYKSDISDASANSCFNVSHLQKSLIEMYEKEIMCDFKVVVAGREFSVHKIVLLALSPVFRAMFESALTEVEKSQVLIEDFSVEAVEKMIEFSYNDRVKDLDWNVVLELYSLADKYQIQKLKCICSSFMKSALSVETVPELLPLAELHSDTELRKVAENFICSNSKAVFQSDAWKNFMKTNIQVASKVMYRICQLFSDTDINPLEKSF